MPLLFLSGMTSLSDDVIPMTSLVNVGSAWKAEKRSACERRRIFGCSDSRKYVCVRRQKSDGIFGIFGVTLRITPRIEPNSTRNKKMQVS